MRQALFHLLTALTAARGVLGVFAVSESTISSTTRLIPVLVGGNSLTFTPNSITAQPGDVIQFQFAARNHTVTQSDAATPCTPATTGQGVNSGFISFDGGASGTVGTFVMPITNTEPMFLYCAQANHCQSGMVMVINGDANSLISYAEAAASASSNTAAGQVGGGVAAKIPLANAIVPTAAAGGGSTSSTTTSASSSSSTGKGMTMTVTKSNGGTATATAFVTVGVGGGTATQFATATVGPSGLSGANGTGNASPSGAAVAAAVNEGVAAASALPESFMGAASTTMMRRGKQAMDVLVVVCTMALGTVVFTARR